MNISLLDHFVLTTEHPKECLRFYTEILGMELRQEIGASKINIHMRPAEFLPAAEHPCTGTLDLCFLIHAPSPSFLLSRTQHLFHPILLRRAAECRGAVLLYDVEYLVPEQIGLLLKRLSHLYKGACNRPACRRMLSNEPVLTHRFLTLNEAGKCLSVTFDEAWIYETLTATLLQPQPYLAENLILTKQLAVALPCRRNSLGVGISFP